MENTIHKFEVVPCMVLDLPVDAKILHVEVQYSKPCMWVLLDASAPRVKRRFETFGTGNVLPDNPGEFIGTFLMHNGAFVFHVFEVK